MQKRFRHLLENGCCIVESDDNETPVCITHFNSWRIKGVIHYATLQSWLKQGLIWEDTTSDNPLTYWLNSVTREQVKSLRSKKIDIMT